MYRMSEEVLPCIYVRQYIFNDNQDDSVCPLPSLDRTNPDAPTTWFREPTTKMSHNRSEAFIRLHGD